MTEQWKPTVGFEGTYEVSNFGRIRRVDGMKTAVGQVLSPSISSTYLRIGLRKNGMRQYFLVHRLVAQAFIGDIPSDCEVDHIDGNRTNNHASNLRICTKSANSWHRGPQGESSKYKGVCIDNRKGGKWQARIMVNASRLFLGYFDSEEEAAHAYDAKAIELQGEFAHLNFPKRGAS